MTSSFGSGGGRGLWKGAIFDDVGNKKHMVPAYIADLLQGFFRSYSF